MKKNKKNDNLGENSKIGKSIVNKNMSAGKQIGIRGKIISAQSREVIANVLKFMKKEAETGIKIPIVNFKQRLLAATGISDNVYRSIVKDLKVEPRTPFPENQSVVIEQNQTHNREMIFYENNS